MSIAPVSPTVQRDAVLKRIDENMQQVRQWSDLAEYALAATYQAKTEALVELLEIADCGSVGGFDKKRGQPGVSGMKGRDRLQVRIDWLKGLKTAG